MRANFFNNVVYYNDNLQFRVYQLVKLLNSIVGSNNVFGRLNDQNLDEKKEKKARKKRNRAKDQQAEQEIIKSNLAMLL